MENLIQVLVFGELVEVEVACDGLAWKSIEVEREIIIMLLFLSVSKTKLLLHGIESSKRRNLKGFLLFF